MHVCIRIYILESIKWNEQGAVNVEGEKMNEKAAQFPVLSSEILAAINNATTHSPSFSTHPCTG